MAPTLGLGLVAHKRWYATSYGALSAWVLCCFFEAAAAELRPQDVITDFCDTWNLDGSSDIEPEEFPGPGGCWEIDSNGDIIPEAV
jgi:hypothetical protein